MQPNHESSGIKFRNRLNHLSERVSKQVNNLRSILSQATRRGRDIETEPSTPPIDSAKIDGIREKLRGTLANHNEPSELVIQFSDVSQSLDNYQNSLPPLNAEERVVAERVLRSEIHRRLNQIVDGILPEINAAIQIQMLKEHGALNISRGQIGSDENSNPTTLATRYLEKKGFGSLASQYAARVSLNETYSAIDSGAINITPDSDADTTARILDKIYYDYALQLADKKSRELRNKYTQIARESSYREAMDMWQKDRENVFLTIKDNLREVGFDEESIKRTLEDVIIPKVSREVRDEK